MAPLGDLGADIFLARHWQKSPRLIRDAFPGFRSPLDGDELAGLACESDIESRIVITHPGPRYALRHGPFAAADFEALGPRDWTLLVQDVDKHLEGFAAFLDHFAFIPMWRVDDLMVSWAADGGSVGPHVDQYDVFLLQAEGRRRWRIGAPVSEPRFLPDHALQVLEEFTATEEWLLEPGDMLYLPPGIPHWGVAEGHCQTWSIGFRAPSHAELVSDFADHVATGPASQGRYADPDLNLDEAAGGQISPAAVARAGRILEQAFAEGQRALPRWFGEMLTSPKAWLQCDPLEHPPDVAMLRRSLEGGTTLTRDPRARLAWMPLPDGSLCLFADGRSREAPARLGELLATLCTEREFPHAYLSRYLGDDDAVKLLCWLVGGGQLRVGDDD